MLLDLPHWSDLLAGWMFIRVFEAVLQSETMLVIMFYYSPKTTFADWLSDKWFKDANEETKYECGS